MNIKNIRARLSTWLKPLLPVAFGLWAGNCYALGPDYGIGTVVVIAIWIVFAVVGFSVWSAVGTIKNQRSRSITAVVIFIGLPAGLFIYRQVDDFQRARYWKQVEEMRVKLCAETKREEIFQTASGVEWIGSRSGRRKEFVTPGDLKSTMAGAQ